MLSHTYTIWLREMKRAFKAKSRVVSSLAMPVFWFLFIGVGFGSVIPGTNYMQFLAPGIIGMILLFNSMFSGISVLWDRQFGFLKEILVAPVSRSSIILGKTIGGASIAVLTGLIMLGLVAGLGVIPIGPGILVAIAFMALTSMFFVAFGLLIASRMQSMEGFQMVMSFVIMPTFFLSGALFPLESTPAWMQAASLFDPLTYGVDGIRGQLTGNSIFPAWMDLGAIFLLTAGMILLAGFVFKKSTS